MNVRPVPVLLSSESRWLAPRSSLNAMLWLAELKTSIVESMPPDGIESPAAFVPPPQAQVRNVVPAADGSVKVTLKFSSAPSVENVPVADKNASAASAERRGIRPTAIAIEPASRDRGEEEPQRREQRIFPSLHSTTEPH